MSHVAPVSPCARLCVFRLLLAISAMASVVVAAWPAVAQVTQVSSGWTQFQGDAAHSGVARDGPEPPFELAWHVPIQLDGPLAEQGLSAPVVADDLVIVVAPEEVLAFDLSTGDRSWSVARTLGPPAQPAVASVEGRDILLYVEGWAGHAPAEEATGPTGASPTAPTGGEQEPSGPVDSHLVAIDLESREPIWEPIELTEVSRSGVTVEGDRAYLADLRGEIFAVDLVTGTVAWTASVDRPVAAPPAVGGDLIVVAARGDSAAPGASVIGLDASDGGEAWRRNIDAPSVVFPSAPAIAGGSVIVPSSDGSVRAFDQVSGIERWSVALGSTPTPFEGAAAISAGGVFATDTTGVTGSVYRLDLASGDLVWDFAVNEPILRGAPVLAGASVLVATDEGSLNAFDPVTGERIWRDERRGALRSLTPGGQALLAIRERPRSGLEAYVPDPDGTLVREASPTTPDYLRIAGGFLIAGIPVTAAALLAGRLLAARLGPAFTDDEELG